MRFLEEVAGGRSSADGARRWGAVLGRANGWATIRAAAAHSFFDSDVTRSNCGAAALPLPLRACRVPSGQSVRALPRANSGWGGLGAAVRSALPRVRRVAGRVRAEKRVIGHIFALGCECRRSFVGESTAGRVSRRERAPSGSLPASGVGCGLRSPRGRVATTRLKRSRDRGRGHAQEIARLHATASTTFCHVGVQGGRLLPAHDLRARRCRTLSCRRASTAAWRQSTVEEAMEPIPFWMLQQLLRRRARRLHQGSVPSVHSDAFTAAPPAAGGLAHSLALARGDAPTAGPLMHPCSTSSSTTSGQSRRLQPAGPVRADRPARGRRHRSTARARSRPCGPSRRSSRAAGRIAPLVGLHQPLRGPPGRTTLPGLFLAAGRSAPEKRSIRSCRRRTTATARGRAPRCPTAIRVRTRPTTRRPRSRTAACRSRAPSTSRRASSTTSIRSIGTRPTPSRPLTVDDAIALLRGAHARGRYLAVGLHKPHMPWQATAADFALHPLESVDLPVPRRRRTRRARFRLLVAVRASWRQPVADADARAARRVPRRRPGWIGRSVGSTSWTLSASRTRPRWSRTRTTAGTWASTTCAKMTTRRARYASSARRGCRAALPHRRPSSNSSMSCRRLPHSPG